MTCAGLSALDVPDADAPIIDELAQASASNPITSVLADAALLELDRYATGRGLRYSRVGTTLMLAAPNEQRLADAIDTVAAAAINSGARLTDVTTQYIDEEKSLASIGIDPWTARPSDEPTGQADCILYVGRDGARVHVKAGRVLVDSPGSLPATSLPKNSVTRIVLSGNVSLSAGACPKRLLRRARRVRARRRHLRRAQPTPTSRPAQRRLVLRVRDPPVRMCRCAHAAGLESSLGVAPAPTDKRPNLALDLMEQFSPLLVDQTVMALLRTRKLRPDHGAIEAGAGGAWLGSDGKEILVDAYEAACQRSVTGALPGYSGSWRRHITHSAQMLAHAITEPDYQWSGVAWR